MCLCSLCEFVVARLLITFIFMSLENVHNCSRAHKHYTLARRGRYFPLVMSTFSHFRYCRPASIAAIMNRCVAIGRLRSSAYRAPPVVLSSAVPVASPSLVPVVPLASEPVAPLLSVPVVPLASVVPVVPVVSAAPLSPVPVHSVVSGRKTGQNP